MQTSRLIALLSAAAIIAAGCQTSSGEATAATSSTFAPLATTSSTAPSTTMTTPPSTTTSTTTTLPTPDCSVERIGTADDFYRKACEQSDIAIVAAEAVDDSALEAAAARMAGLLAERPDLADSVAASINGVAVIGQSQRLTDLPEFVDIYKIHPGTDWHRLGRSFPGTEEIPVAAGAEENLLCLESDRYEGEDMFLRDFGWTIRRFGISLVDHDLDRDIEAAYGRAIAADLWRNTVAEVNSNMYWAEGVQSFFDANNEEIDEKDQIHNHVDTRDELRAYDPFLYALLVRAFGETSWRPEC
jgi:hypothetical protein